MAHEEHKEKVSTMRAEYGYNGTYLRSLPENAKHIKPNVKSGTEVLVHVQQMWRKAIIHVPKNDKGEEFRDKYRVYYSQRSGNISATYGSPKKGKTVLTVSMNSNVRFYPTQGWNECMRGRDKLVKKETYEDGSSVWTDSGIYILPKKERLMV